MVVLVLGVDELDVPAATYSYEPATNLETSDAAYPAYRVNDAD